MTARPGARLFGPLMFWTVLTGIFAWLPLMRIIGRPMDYTWGVLGLTGEGTEGPFWIFGLLTIFVVTMLFTLLRGPRALARPMVVLWHLLVTGVVIAGVFQGGSDATLQGQGLGFSIPLWILAVPFVAFAAIAVVWAILDAKGGTVGVAATWGPRNSWTLAASLVLAVIALAFFRAGTNYNWVTACAIVVTVAHWVLLVRSFGGVTTVE